MVDMDIFYSSLMMVGVIIVAGFILGKLKVITSEMNKHLITLLLTVAWPAALFRAYPQAFDAELFSDFLWGLVGGVLVLGTMIALSKLIFNKWLFKGELAYMGQFAFIFNNASFLGFPLVMAIYGEDGLLPYCGFILVFNLALFGYGVYLFKRKLDWQMVRSTLLNPNVIAVVLGTVFFLFSLQLPSQVNGAIGSVAAIMTPMSLLCIGFMLSRAKLKALVKKWRLFVAAAVQLICGPLVAFGLMQVFGFPAEIATMMILLQALPTATSLGLFAEKYGGDSTSASELVLISTIMSVVTLPIMLGLLITG